MSAASTPTLDDLLQRFLALTEAARRATASGDATALASALDVRELDNVRLLALSRAAAARTPLPAATKRLVDEALRANDALAAQVTGARDDIRRQLERLARDETGVAGYAAALPRAGRVDVRR